MVLIALDDVELPTVFGNPGAQIQSLLLNKEQLEAVEVALTFKKVLIRGIRPV